jgi:hydroxymethylbilane synthase
MTRVRKNQTIKLRLGTRGSPLALAQSRLTVNALRRAHPDLKVELITLETPGDRDQQTALFDVKDTNFFSADLDSALNDHRVDFCVHSVKDLATDRPAEIVRAAMPPRENPRDVVVFRGNIIERLKQGRLIRIGSSSERRRQNVERFLTAALPQFNGQPRLHFSALRGAVDRRLTRIHRAEDEPEALDGVVLALAGLNRLSQDPLGKKIVTPLLTGARWMVLPPSACPAAAGQGALALECRRDDDATRSLLRTLHDPVTETLIRRELKYIKNCTDSERSGLGVTAINTDALGPVLYARGPQLDEAIWDCPPAPAGAIPWDGRQAYRPEQFQWLPIPVSIQASDTLFIAHWHAVTKFVSIHEATRIWVSGVKSWRQLAARGLWVEGCADNLGFADIVPTLASAALGLPALKDWTVLTHRDAKPGWHDTGPGRIVATYAPVSSTQAAGLEATVRNATHFFWGSAGQYSALKAWVPANAHHACGVGKTAAALRALGLSELQSFPSRKEWQSWLR